MVEWKNAKMGLQYNQDDQGRAPPEQHDLPSCRPVVVLWRQATLPANWTGVCARGVISTGDAGDMSPSLCIILILSPPRLKMCKPIETEKMGREV